MRDKPGKTQKRQSSAGNTKPPSGEPKFVIPQPFTIRKESSTEENKQYSDERETRWGQLRVAKQLNRISFIGGITAFASFIALMLTIYQTRKQFRADERAWVMVEFLRIDPDIALGQTRPIQFSIKNFGKSPSIDTHSHTEIKLSGGSCQGGAMQVSPYDSREPIPPGESHVYGDLFVQINSQSCLDSLWNGKANLSIEGRVDYDDVFGEHHFTTYCTKYEGVTIHQFSYCDSGNAAK